MSSFKPPLSGHDAIFFLAPVENFSLLLDVLGHSDKTTSNEIHAFLQK